jgi:hypothetical protein
VTQRASLGTKVLCRWRRRQGRVDLLVMLPNGRKRLIPQAWTDAKPAGGVAACEGGDDPAATLGAVEDLAAAVVIASALSRPDLLLRFKGGTLSELTVPLRRPQPSIRTDEDTIALLRRLAMHYTDAKIAGILNRQGRRTARGLSYTASRVQSLRHHWNITRYQPSDQPPEGELLNVSTAAKILGIAPSTLLRWLGDGFVAGEQVTPGAPWRIRLTDELRRMVVGDAPDGWLALHHASRALGVSRQTVLQKVKRGELRAVLTRTGRRKGLRIQVQAPQDALFETPTITEGAV